MQFSSDSRRELIRTGMVRIMAALRRFGAQAPISFASALLWHNALLFLRRMAWILLIRNLICRLRALFPFQTNNQQP